MLNRLFVRSFCASKVEKMVRVLNVAEKNDAAKSLANVMSRGGSRMRDGFSRFNKIYEFDYNLFNQNCKMTMTSVSGHLLGLEFIGQYKKWYGCSPAALFDVAVEKYCPENYQDIKRTLEREVRGCQYLVIWTDCDREGENIGFEIIQVCKAVKQNIPVYRARFSEITPGAVQRACANLIQPDKNVSDAVDVRQELDLRIGAAFTRFQTLRLQKIFPDVLADQLISYGSCQFPTLGFVVERYKQVEAFVPEPFWKLKVTHTQDEENVEFNWKRIRLFDSMACFVLYEHCVENPTATVADVKSKSKSKWRPNPLDTVELEKLASRKLRIGAKDTMKIAEKLYTQGFISYPRTETNKFPPDIGLARLVEQQTVDPNWGDFARRVLEHGPNPRNGNKTDQAHPPIHPTKYTNSLQGNEQRLYEFIVRHFLACCSQDAQGQETTVEIIIADERFSAQGLMIIARNYLDVYPYDRWSAKVIPVYTAGDTFQPNSIEMTEGETSPPPLLTEADLIALMDKHGIGTDATHAEHIETIKSRMYVGVRPDGRLVPGQLGMGLVEGYDAMGYEMSKPNLRAQLEADLKRICEGRKDRNVVLQEQIHNYKEVFLVACRQALKIDTALAQYLGEARSEPVEDVLEILASEPVRKCPNCRNDMLLKTKKNGKGYFIGCMGYPGCKNVMWLPDFVIEAAVQQSYCDTCSPDRVRHIKFKFKRGSVPPMTPTEYVGCIGGCDATLNEALNIKQWTGSSQRSGAGGSGPTSGRPGSTSVRPGSTSDKPGSTSVRPGSTSGRPGSTSVRPGATSGRPGSTSVRPGSTSGRPGSTSGRPGSTSGPAQGRPGPTPRTQSSFSDSGYSSQYSNSGTTQNSYRNNQTWTNSNHSDNSRVPLVPVSPFSHSAHTTGNDNPVVCDCGEDAISLTVRKEGPNTGRKFYKCNSSKCKFFLWDDEAGSGGGGSTARQPPSRGGGQWGKPQKRSAPDQGNGSSVKRARKCGLCGAEGHTRKTCPHK